MTSRTSVLTSILMLILAAAPAAGDASPEKTITAGLVAPQRVALSSSGELFVVDARARALVILGLHSGEVVSRFPYPGLTSVAVDWQRRLLVGGTFGARVLVFFPTTGFGIIFHQPFAAAKTFIDRTL